jgi:uncharacterized membrane protein YfcA
LTSAGRPKEDRVQVLGNHPSAAFGQALPYHRRGRTAAETMGCAMGGLDVPELVLFIGATFAASFVAGFAGFAFGIVAAAVWLHFLSPGQSAALIVAFGLIVQGMAVWKLRRAVKLGRLAPFLIGGAIGVPIGAELLWWTSPAALRVAIGIILVVFSVYSLWRPKLGSASSAGPVADGGIGILNGVIGGATGLAGIAATVWCGLRGWPPAEQRAVFQPVGVAVFVMAALWFGGTGAIQADTLGLFLIGLPALAAGTWAGLQLFGRLDESGFRRVILVLLLVSGVSLLVTGR